MGSPAAAAPTRGQALSLFRSLLRAARGFTDYNVREYAKRRTVDSFRHNRHLTDSPATAALADGYSQLDVAKRQSTVYSLYAPSMRNILEINQSTL